MRPGQFFASAKQANLAFRLVNAKPAAPEICYQLQAYLGLAPY
jgi:hypothetical protein